MTVFVLMEEFEIVGVFKTLESARKCADELELHCFTIDEFTLKN